MKKRLSLSAVAGQHERKWSIFWGSFDVTDWLISSTLQIFFTARNLINVTRQSATNGLLAFGMTYVRFVGPSI